MQADVECLFKETIDTFGGVIVVVNCAGSMLLSSVARDDLELFDKVFATNLRGTFLVVRQAARHVLQVDKSLFS
jgi:3-oxoacyl-[acyl-carrier protein] reductase